MTRALPYFTLAAGLIFGCTPREQASTDRDTVTSISVSGIENAGELSHEDSLRKKLANEPIGEQDSEKDKQNSDTKIMRKSITNVLEANTHAWMDIPGVNGTGEGRDPNGNPAIIIFTDRDASEIQSKLPGEKDGYPIIIREIGVVKPLEVED